ncbi:MAG: SUMF1/EgtB/PvdO family nonheme iron enzyme [Armatimonadetes bacterium]|nr:SUMF1/EgtB/PvdO family nonheme iron enzyme [Anaerolineae bacterium]
MTLNQPAGCGWQMMRLNLGRKKRMARDYGKVGSGRRSGGGAVLQWLVIGVVFGFGCAALVFFGLLITGYVGIDATGSGRIGSTPTALVLIVTATDDPAQPTATAIVVTATVPTQPTQASQIILPTITPAQPIETPTATTDLLATPATAATVASGLPQPTAQTTTAANPVSAGVPALLEPLISSLVFVQGGTFRMGTTQTEVAEAVRRCTDEGGQCQSADADDAIPQHEVTLTDFQMEANEVTFEQYVTFLNYLKTIGQDHTTGCKIGGLANLCAFVQSAPEDISNITYDTNQYEVVPSFYNEYPVVNVTWFGADTYCRTIGRRLPTEAEWEFAARGTDENNIHPWGRDWNVDFAHTSQTVTADGTPVNSSVAVTTFPDDRSTFGVLNMAGNVSEWVADWYSGGMYATYASSGVVVNPTGPERGSNRVVRGGNWAFNPFFARVVQRLDRVPGEDFPTIGFRCAADVQQPASSLGDSAVAATGVTPPLGTPDPAALGVIGDNNANAGAPTLPAVGITPTTPAVNITPSPLPPLPPGG